jgi:hypothetical protein
MLGLRLGLDPRVCITTTPRTTALVKDLVASRTTALTRGTTLENERHLSPEFIRQIITVYQGTRLGEQELEGKLIEYSDAQWFISFRRDRHVSLAAEFNPMFPCLMSVDCGVSRYTGGLLYQFVPIDRDNVRMHVFADFLSVDRLSEENAADLLRLAGERLPGGTLDAILLDPASGARTGIGPAAEAAYWTVFGRRVRRWPLRPKVDSLGLIESLLGSEGRPPSLLVHPRCETLISAFFGYERAQRGGEYLDQPRDPNHPHEEAIDCLAGAVVDRWPEGRRPVPNYRRMHVSQVF